MITRLLPKKANPFAPRTYGSFHKVTPRSYIFRGIVNSSVLIGDKGVAIVDTQVNRSLAQELLKAIRGVTDKPILYVINTHYHWDHTNGNAVFAHEGAEIVASALTKDFMVSRAPRQKAFLSGRGFELGLDPQLPDTVFEGETELDLGNFPLRLFFAGKAESDDATAIYAPSEGILMAGDTIMTGSFPIFGQPVWDEGLQCDGQWQATIAELMKLNPKVVFPGHGPLAKKKDVDKLLKICNYFDHEVKKRVDAGMRLDEILTDMESHMPGWLKRMPIVWGTPRYAILRVYRGLTKNGDEAEPGWQKYKPTVIPHPKTQAECEAVEECFQLAEQAKEGGDQGLRAHLLHEATRLDPSNPTAWSSYASTLIELSRNEPSVLEKGDFFNEAREAWDKALQIDGDHVDSLVGKGSYLTMMAYRGGDDPSEGLSLLNKADELTQDSKVKAEISFYLGMGHRRLGEENEAKTRFHSSLKLDPAFMPARLALAA